MRTIDIVVGQGSSVIDFEIRNTGYGFGQGEILTVHMAEVQEFLLILHLPYKEFQITIDRILILIHLLVGLLVILQVLDDFDDLCDGTNKSFPIKLMIVILQLELLRDLILMLEACLLVFVNDILQKPGEAYTFQWRKY